MIAEPIPPSVLVVEDSDEDFAAMERILRRAAVPVGLKRCTGADQTLNLLDEMNRDPKPAARAPALIVLDLNLPGRDGRYVLRELRSREALRKIPVVIFSTSDSAQDITWCYENGANSYHVKDINYTGFKSAVEQLSTYWLTSAHIPGRQSSFPSS